MNNKHQEVFDKLDEYANEFGFLNVENADPQYLHKFIKKTKEHFEKEDETISKQLESFSNVVTNYVLIPVVLIILSVLIYQFK